MNEEEFQQQPPVSNTPKELPVNPPQHNPEPILPVQPLYSSSPPLQPLPKRSNMKLFLILGVLLVICMLAGAGFWYLMSNKTEPQQSSANVNNNSADKTEILEVTEKYEETGYSLLYPKGWEVEPSPFKSKSKIIVSKDYNDTATVAGTDIPTSNEGYIFAPQMYTDRSTSITGIDNYASQLDYLKKQSDKVKNITETTVNGNKAINSYNINYHVLYVFKDKTTYIFSLSAPKVSAAKVNELFNKIVASIVIK